MPLSIQRARSSAIILLLVATGCSYWPASERHPADQPGPREYLPRPAPTPNYFTDVKPVIERRCTVCHSCYDSPCQLKLDSYQGLLRGANKEPVYNGTRLLGALPTRLFEDAQTTGQWRAKEFFPVLNEGAPAPAPNLEQSPLAQLLLLKREHPLPPQTILPESFDLGLNRAQVCPRADEMAQFRREQPLWGMPYGLPGLSPDEHELLLEWLQRGAEPGKPPALSQAVLTQVAQWEEFLNGSSPKAQLVNRYIYEHLFLANLHFSSAPNIRFRLVRSSTPPGQPLQRISTARPFDDPGVPRVYYRLWHDPSTVVSKTHLPYALTEERWSNWQRWFYQTAYRVDQLPSYDPATAANPFVTFAQLPADSRYRFMLDEAQFTIMNFIKGPVCRGNIALNVIQDHFWVFFLAPQKDIAEYEEKLFRRTENFLSLPAAKANTYWAVSSWLEYADMQQEYLKAKAEAVSRYTHQQAPLNMQLIWDGEGRNKNAALTIFRHSDSASVHQGLMGQQPKTAWVIGYPLLERIHYLLVAGFDVYGNVSHQLLTRMYMDFLRMEGELNFVGFLPQPTRRAVIAGWYLDAERVQEKYLDAYLDQLMVKSDLEYTSADPPTELLQRLRQHLGPIAASPYDSTALRYENLFALHGLQGSAIRFLPQVTLIEVPGEGVYTLLRNNEYTNLSSLFGETLRHRPQQDTTTLGRGVIGAYPNSFMRVERQDLADFVQRMHALRSEQDYQRLRDIYGVRRTDPTFWDFSDRLHNYYKKQVPLEAGMLDYNRLENR